MAGKFSGSAPRLLLLSVAALVMLSGAIVTEEARQCYWCGPLAEQVHRSRRAPPCDAPGNQVTTCDPGLSYCAIVAISPPYVESRLCVKNYREECYPLYCNSTRTWKMTCACKENLCNGPNTERETEAFAVLPKLVEKNQNKRITKRTGQSSGKLIKNKTEQNLIVTNTSGIQENLVNGTFEESNEAKEQLTEIILFNEPEINSGIDNLVNDIQSTEDSVTTDDIEDTTIEVDDIKITETEVKEKIAVITTDEPEIKTNIQKPTMISRIDDTKPSEELPTAEALQQNASPVVSEKTTTVAPTTSNFESTTITTTENVEKPTEPPVHHKNRDIKTNSSILMIILTYILIQVLKL